MTEINLTLFRDMPNAVLPPGASMRFGDVVADFCAKIDHKILILLMVILSLYVLRVFMIPWAFDGFREIIPNEYLKAIMTALNMLISFLDTGSLIAAGLMLYIFWEQAAITGIYWTWLAVLAVIVILAAFMSIMRFVRGKR